VSEIGLSKFRLILLCGAALLGSACSDDDDDYDRGPRPELSYGTLEVRWSIDGRTDAEACEDIGAVAFQTDLYDQGYFVGDLEVPCADFSVTQELYVDDYLARSTLLDEDGFYVVRRVVEDFFEVGEDQVTLLEMDFPNMAAAPMNPSAGADAGVSPADAGGEPEPGEPPDAGPAPASDAGDAGTADAGT
jgi:hypothetical protein